MPWFWFDASTAEPGAAVGVPVFVSACRPIAWA